MAHKKAEGGSSGNGRRGRIGKRLGVKRFGGRFVSGGKHPGPSARHHIQTGGMACRPWSRLYLVCQDRRDCALRQRTRRAQIDSHRTCARRRLEALLFIDEAKIFSEPRWRTWPCPFRRESFSRKAVPRGDGGKVEISSSTPIATQHPAGFRHRARYTAERRARSRQDCKGMAVMVDHRSRAAWNGGPIDGFGGCPCDLVTPDQCFIAARGGRGGRGNGRELDEEIGRHAQPGEPG